jgi:hypothetical protein
MDVRVVFNDLGDVEIVLDRVEADPGKKVASIFGVLVKRLVHVPDECHVKRFGHCPLSEGAHLREQDDLANRLLIGQQHEQPVNSDAKSTRGGHAVLERLNEVFVEDVSFFVAPGACFDLLGEARTLIDSIVEFGEGVRHFDPANERFETLDQVGMPGLSLC